MSNPALETLPRPIAEVDMMRWSQDLTRSLERQLRDFLLPFAEILLVNGNNNDVDFKGALLVRISGPTAVFAITGIRGGATGKPIFIYNSTTQNMTISNQSGFSQATNRILTMSGADVPSISSSSSILVYVRDRWVLFGSLA